MGRGTIRPHQAMLPKIGEGRIKQAACAVTGDRRGPHQAGHVYMGTRPVMAIGVACEVSACEVSVCHVWHVCGGRLGGVHRRVGGACGCGTCERLCVRDVVSLCGQAYTPPH
jgi:hypothetical protein